MNRSLCSRRELGRLAIGAAVVIGGLSSASLGAAAQDDVAAAGFGAGQTAVVVDGPLNLRTGAGTGYSVIEQLATGAYVDILSGPISADGYAWYQVNVQLTANTGYVAGAYLGSVSGGSFAIGDTVYVDTDVLNVRSGPGTGYAVIDSLSTGDQGEVIDGPVNADGYTWYEVNYSFGGYSGWVAGEFLSYAGGGGIGIGDNVTVTTDHLNVRSGPGTGYAVIDSLNTGDRGVVLDGPTSANGYTWYEINYSFGGYSGWVAGEYLVLT
jgi:N-acetylmuramoyl-L-alanine amidase